jgi:hypothetical protein
MTITRERKAELAAYDEWKVYLFNGQWVLTYRGEIVTEPFSSKRGALAALAEIMS